MKVKELLKVMEAGEIRSVFDEYVYFDEKIDEKEKLEKYAECTVAKITKPFSTMRIYLFDPHFAEVRLREKIEKVKEEMGA